MSPAWLLEAQRAVGNRAVTHIVQRASDGGDTAEQTPSAGPATGQGAAGDARSRLARFLTGRGVLVKGLPEDLLHRLTAGPLFDDSELAAIKNADRNRLEHAGVGEYEAAEAYYTKGKFHDWLRLPPGRRLLIATIAWNRDRNAGQDAEERKNPAFTLGRALRLRKPEGLSQEEFDAISAEQDKQIRDAFVDTLVPRPRPEGGSDKDAQKVERARDILTRVFLILQNGLRVYRKGSGHVDYKEGDVAKALAHGGRVNIRIPQWGGQGGPFDLPDWLRLTEAGKDVDPKERAWFGTHRVSIDKNKDDTPGTGKFEEQGEVPAGLTNILVHGAAGKLLNAPVQERIYRMNLAAGGWGNKDFQGDVIVPDGGHGHLFLNFQPPEENQDGVLQIGIETTGPGAKSPVGYKHNLFSTEKSANPESSFYGHKADKIGEGKLADNQRVVLLQEFGTASGGWQDFLRHVEGYWNSLREAAEQDPEEIRKLYERLVGPRGEDRPWPPPPQGGAGASSTT